MKLEDAFNEKFVCQKCNHRHAKIDRFAATGTGFSRFFDIQHKKYVTVSCRNCGYTEIFNPEFLEGKEHLVDVLDLIFGG